MRLSPARVAAAESLIGALDTSAANGCIGSVDDLRPAQSSFAVRRITLLGEMKRAFVAFLIAVVCAAVLGLHAWCTWDEASLPGVAGDRDFVLYSLFLESFAFTVSAAYFVGPKIYRMFGEADAARKFAGEKERVSSTVHFYSAIAVVLRRLWFDHAAGVSLFETMIVISLISAPVVISITRKRRVAPKNA